MATRDLYNNVKTIASLAPAVRTASANGTSLDTQGYESVVAIAQVGAEGDTLSASVKIEFELEDSPDDSTFTACAAADVQGAVAGTATGCFAAIVANTGAPAIHKAGYKGSQRYVRIAERRTGTHTVGTPTNAVLVGSNPHYRPVS